MVSTFAPGLYTGIWRLTHSRQIKFAGAEFIVPTGWVTMPKSWGDSSKLSLMRLPVTLFGKQGNYPLIIISQRRDSNMTNGEALARWKVLAPSQFESRGYKIRNIKEFQTPTAVVCLELSSATGRPESICFFEINRLMASYYGDEQLMDTLYKVITSARF